jgi:hypothetical protein
MVSKLYKISSKTLNLYLRHLFSLTVEMTIVDLSFSFFYNLVSDYRKCHATADKLGRWASSSFLNLILLHYLQIGANVIYRPDKLYPFDKVLVLENLKFTAMTKRNVPLHLLNVILKLKIVLLMATIIVF